MIAILGAVVGFVFLWCVDYAVQTAVLLAGFTVWSRVKGEDRKPKGGDA